MKRLAAPLLLALFVLPACASDNTSTAGSSGDASSGGSDGTGGSGGSGGTGGSGGSMMACTQDCSTIQVPSCFQAVCNTQTGTCDVGPAMDGTACDDGQFCTDNDTCQAGTCVAGGPRDCSGGDPDPCRPATCDEATDTCGTTTINNGMACTSPNPCLSNTTCFNGQCIGQTKDCSGTPLDSPECQAAICNPDSGQCEVKSIAEGTSCTYGDICEENKKCEAGQCLGDAISNCTTCNETEPNNTPMTASTGNACLAWSGAIT
jgi:hypothetical protein